MSARGAMGARPEAVAIAVFAKAPVPGYAKTRLAATLGAEGAAALQARFLARTIETALAAGTGPVSLWCAPDCDHPAFRAHAARHGLVLHPQGPGDLGARMAAAFAARTPLLLIGTDCPPLRPAHLRACAQALRAGEDAVFLPAEDGGYVLVGLRRPMPDLFRAMEWGTARVMDDTRARLRAAGARWREPAVLWDVDEPADLARAGIVDADRRVDNAPAGTAGGPAHAGRDGQGEENG